MNFGQAVELLKNGKLVARGGWNGKNMFLFIRPAFSCELGAFEKIISVPENAKQRIVTAICSDKYNGGSGVWDFKFTGYISMFAADGTIVNGWLASQTDILAEDWSEVKNNFEEGGGIAGVNSSDGFA